jgi:hypothetical protein
VQNEFQQQIDSFSEDEFRALLVRHEKDKAAMLEKLNEVAEANVTLETTVASTVRIVQQHKLNNNRYQYDQVCV